MSQLKNKSDINGIGAELLHKNALYPSVIHCAYYSCLQYMKHLLLNQGIKEDEFGGNGEGTHAFIINKMYKHLNSVDAKRSKEVNTKIGQLKKLRVNSDYSLLPITITESQNSMTLSKEILSQLKKT